MIKIEITEPHKENPDVLVRLAGFLMECAGHKMVKAPENDEGMFRLPVHPEGIHQKAAERFNEILKNPNELKTDELPGPTGHGVASAPYQHCGESDLTHHVDTTIDILAEVANVPSDMIKGNNIECSEFNKVVEETLKEAKKPKSRKKPTKKLEADDGTVVNVNNTKFPSGVAIKQNGTWVDLDAASPPLPPLDIRTSNNAPTNVPSFCPIEIIPVNKVNGNTLIDKIVKGTAEGKLNHTIVTQIVRKHGLESTKDVFTNEHLIPAINDSIDELLRGG